MEPNEVEFLAEKEMISIVPNFSQDKIYLIAVSNRVVARDLSVGEICQRLLLLTRPAVWIETMGSSETTGCVDNGCTTAIHTAGRV